MLSAEAGVFLIVTADGSARVGASIGIPVEKARSFSVPRDASLREELRRGLGWPEGRSQSALVVAAGGRTEGLLGLLFPSGPAPGEEEAMLLSLLADQAALALQDVARAEERKALAEISDLLATTSFDYRETQRRIARLAVDLLGGMCGVVEARPDGQLGRAAMFDASPARQGVAEQMQKTMERTPGSLVARAAATRATILINIDQAVAARPGDEERIRLHKEMGTRAVLAVPMMSRGQLVGVLGFSSPRGYSASDVHLAGEVARRAAAALDNASLHEQSRFQAAVAAHLAEGIVLVRLDDESVAFANSRAEEMFGYAPGEMIGLPATRLKASNNEDSRAILARILREAESAGSWHGQVQNVRKDGSTFWSAVSASVFDHPEIGRVLLTARNDISARKALEEASARALREKEVLLKEIHHRVKNNLQVIASLFYLQRRRAADKQVQSLLDESRSRIESIALIHEQLCQANNLAGVDFDEYLNRLLAAIVSAFDATNVKARSSAPGVVLEVDQAVPCALIVSELLSNSLKHAFQGHPREVWVTASLEDGRTVVLEVGDNGVGIPANVDWRASHGLGLQLVQSLTKQLCGTLELDRSRGARFTLRFPLASAHPAEPEAPPG